MRVASTLVGLTLMALAPLAQAAGAGAPDGVAPPPARASVEAASPPAGPPKAAQRRYDLVLSLLPMEAGKYTTPLGLGDTVTSDASFAYGLSLNFNARIIRGLWLGLAPQVLWNVQPKVSPSQLTSLGASNEYDLLLRVAYEQALVDGISLYGEVLPGYSALTPPMGKGAKGAVVALGVGVTMDLTDRIFASIGAGYQFGFQALSVAGESADNRTRYIRLTLGAGIRL